MFSIVPILEEYCHIDACFGPVLCLKSLTKDLGTSVNKSTQKEVDGYVKDTILKESWEAAPPDRFAVEPPRALRASSAMRYTNTFLL